MSYGQDSAPLRDQYVIRERLRLPGIFLAVVGGINLLIGAYALFGAIQYLRMDEVQKKARFEEQWEQIPETTKKQYADAGISKEQLAEMLAVIQGPGAEVFGAVALLAGFLTTFGGIRMSQARSYGLAVTGAILAAIPVVSPCCLGGQIVGIWAMVVLFSRDVRQAFRTAALPPEDDRLMS
jgi:hypothetical protein